VGAPLATAYGAALVLRNAFAPAPAHAGVPILCVGNLTAGGTGKTPAVAWVVEVLRRAGRRPAVLTRGYGGDETVLLERLLPGIPVIVEPDRVAGAARAVSAGADVLVMDDGFQHRRLHRDLDLVLLDATDPFGGGHLLPWGRLREPKEALGRAGAVLITRADQAAPEAVRGIREEIARLSPKALIVEAVHAPVDVEGLKGLRVFAVCGIGNPGAFHRTLAGFGASVAGSWDFPDHHAYRAADVEAVNKAAAGLPVVTTQKDWVKLEALPAAAGWKTLKIRLEMRSGREALEERILRR